MNKQMYLLAMTLVLSSCFATGQAPLVYVSKQTLGVEISSGAQDAGTASVVLGFRNLDAAYVPTTATYNKDETLVRIRGCYNHGHNVGKIDSCAHREKAHFNNVETDTTTSSKGNLDQNTHKVGALSVGFSPVLNYALEVDPRDTGEGGDQHQSISDSLSVYGTFDSETKKGSEVGIGLGKVFATGVAAQHLTEGVSLKQRREAKASNIQKKTECINAVKAALGDKTTATDLSICN